MHRDGSMLVPGKLSLVTNCALNSATLDAPVADLPHDKDGAIIPAIECRPHVYWHNCNDGD